MLEVIVDGIVGVGKTTLVEIMKDEFEFTPFFEMEDEKVDYLLGKFYSDGKRWSFTLQTYFLNKRFYQMKKAEKEGHFIMDRSIYGDFVFAKAQYIMGMMSELEWKIYQDIYNNLVEHVVPPRLMIYLRCSVETAVKRLRKRGRQYEQDVDVDYWKFILKLYEELFRNYDESMLLVVDADVIDFVENEKDREKVLSVVSELLSINKGVFSFDGKELKRIDSK
ncbi:MAG: deoxynucleoside kinase [Thermotogaceae bacterium]|nr:deoxynucleoside kinase [Thermotogaceae bacterium]